ncbi:Cat eye syndrome critical region protein 5 [Fasciolopsis buskii]|uniref:Cat eye syndrome critical region protein 5 n=1 Tax=Fasciolopsis buskii TaxID=27845 RepID=A0A8E0RUD1_9TREM|nr:Cat eye syndrome critical region protein 5 [Fasciolopsis buski]
MANSYSSRQQGLVGYDSYGEPIFRPSDDPEVREQLLMFDSNSIPDQIFSHLVKLPILKLQPNFGLLFDIDGVLGRGAVPLPQAQEAFRLLCDPDCKELRVPVAFVTNACVDGAAKSKMLSSWFKVPIYADQVIQAPSPLTAYKEFHKKRVLFIGQDNTLDVAHSLGFVNAVTIDDVKAAYPLLDMVDHENRKSLVSCTLLFKNFRHAFLSTELSAPYPTHILWHILVIIMLGEPRRWETHLQLLIDLLMTNGKPDHTPNTMPEEHIPIVACNMDLVYMDQAVLPRFGHGAFLTCLQALYRQFTGHKLRYTSLLGKPSEITFRYAEHMLTVMSRRMGYTRSIERMYFFGDNPDVDILGANLYNNFIRRYRHVSGGSGDYAQEQRVSVADSRMFPSTAEILPQTARSIDAVLVQTGVYKPDARIRQRPSYCHRDFQGATDLILPTFEVQDCFEGIQMILAQHNFYPNIRKSEEIESSKPE